MARNLKVDRIDAFKISEDGKTFTVRVFDKQRRETHLHFDTQTLYGTIPLWIPVLAAAIDKQPYMKALEYEIAAAPDGSVLLHFSFLGGHISRISLPETALEEFYENLQLLLNKTSTPPGALN